MALRASGGSAGSASGKGAAFAAVRDKHAQGNRRSKDDWELYRHHRERLTGAIEGLAGGAGKLVLLGAGNCNDVDLERVAGRFDGVHLVDIDAGALDRARARLSPEVRGRTVAHGGIDLTGLLPGLDRTGGKLAGDAKGLEAAVDAGADAIVAGLPVGEGGVVVSCCLLSQLGWSLEEAAGGDEERGMQLRIAALTIHLRTLARLCRPGGVALIAADIVSSDLYPLDEVEEGTDIGALAASLIPQQEIVYAAANPVLLARLVRRDPVLQAAFAAPEILPAWLWTGQFERTYLVYPQVLRRK